MPKSQFVDPGKVFEPGYIDFDSIPLCRYNKTIEEVVLADERSKKYLEGMQVMKVIIVPKRMVNIVLKK